MDTHNIDNQSSLTLNDRCVYIAGPMTGYEEFNFPAFDEASHKYKEQGYQVINPADLARNRARAKNVEVSQLPLRELAHVDISIMTQQATHIYMLNGWQYSKGAKAEHAMAEWLGLNIVYQSKEDLKAAKAHDKEWWYSFQSELFNDILTLTRKKNADYTGGKDTHNPFANFDASNEFGVDPLVGLSVRMSDKFQRLKAFCNDDLALTTKGDTAEDIFKDLIGYSAIALGMLHRTKSLD